MSGGAFDYVYYRIEEAAHYTHDPEIRELLCDLGKLLYEEEWYYSGDTEEERYQKALRLFKQKWLGGTDARLLRMVEFADQIYRDAHNKIVNMIGGADA